MKINEEANRDRSSRLGLFTILASLFLALVPAGTQASTDDLAELSLEDLLEVELDQMSIAGIHHTHEQGEWMVGYRFMAMGMDGMRDGSRALTDGQVLATGFAVTPTSMYVSGQSGPLLAFRLRSAGYSSE